MKEHQNDRYLTTQDGEVFDRLTNSFVVDIEPINTYEKMPQKVDGDNAEAVAETILKALSSYEKLQGVDGMKRKVVIDGGAPSPDFIRGYNQAIDDVKARLVADIGGK